MTAMTAMTANTLYKNSCHTEKELPSENQDTLTGVLEDSEHRLCIAIKAGGIAERGRAPVTPIMKEDSFFET